MNPNVKYFPLCKQCKSPRGAVAVGEPVLISMQFCRPSNPEYVYLVITKDSESPVRYEMERVGLSPDGWAEYRRESVITSRGLYHYHFEVVTTNEQHYIGCDESLHAMLDKGSEWQLTVYERTKQIPSWQKGGVYYQIMPDRFFIGGERKKSKQDVVYRDDWDGIPEYHPDSFGKIRNNDFFGGNLKGITKKLAYIKSLGVTCIYLNPIFEARSNHKYDTGSYRRIDPDFGTEDDLKELIKKAAKKGIRVMLDGVFSHTGDDSIYFNRYGTYDSIGAYQSAQSPYAEWYSFSDDRNHYASWWGIETLPNTVEENPAYCEFITGEDGVIRTWSRLGLGGWRLDVADELPDGFLDNVAQAAKAVNPDIMVLGEVWEDASNKSSYGNLRRYLNGGQLDSVTNYPFKEAILNFVKTGETEPLQNTVHQIINNYPKEVLDNLMNLLGTHDTVRLLTHLGKHNQIGSREERAKAKLTNPKEALKKLQLATVLQYTLPGVPCVYYGDEAGVEGFEDPFNRRTYPWGNQNKEILRWYRRLGKIRTENHAVYAEGHFKLLESKNGVIVFQRRIESQMLITIANAGGESYRFDCDKLYIDLLTGKPFQGIVATGMAVILKETTEET